MFKKYKIITVFLIIAILFVFTGCRANKFEVTAPPLNPFPTPEEYKKGEVEIADFYVEKSFNGNKSGNRLIVTSDAQTHKDFVVGEKGKITYTFNGKQFEYDAVLVSCPTGNESGDFIAEAEFTNQEIRDNFPGKFSVVTYFKSNAILIPKKAALVIDDNNNAVVLQVGEDGILTEKNIVVGNVNENYYEVLSGINPGEEVVVR